MDDFGVHTPVRGGSGIEVFSFGDPTPVLDSREILDYMVAEHAGNWYAPPVSFEGLARSFRASVHHSSALLVKRNMLLSAFVPCGTLSRADFSRFALDFLIFGNAYVERVNNRMGGVLSLSHVPAKYVRRGSDLAVDQFWFVPLLKAEHAFSVGSVCQVSEPDINQEVYGLPEYLSALQSAWLNESATLFRRKYYMNGSHAGFVMYMTDPAHNEEDVANLRQALKDSKGPGNFRNLFMYSPNGKKDGLQIIPVSDVSAKDEFFNVKNVTRDDVLAAHRVPPQLLGIIPSNTGGFGDAATAAEVFWQHEIVPLQQRFLELNDWAGMEAVRFSR